MRYFSADSKRDGFPHIFLRIDVVLIIIAAHSRDVAIVAESKGLIAISKHSGAFGQGIGYGVKLITSRILLFVQ
jgi:hypothetical protein